MSLSSGDACMLACGDMEEDKILWFFETFFGLEGLLWIPWSPWFIAGGGLVSKHCWNGWPPD